MKEDEVLTMNMRQMAALHDLITGYTGPDWTPALDGRTRAALERREMWDEKNQRVLDRGLAYRPAIDFDIGWYIKRRRGRRRLRAVS